MPQTAHMPSRIELDELQRLRAGGAQALNGHYRYQLTVVDSRFAQAIVTTPMSNNRFSIRTSRPHVRISWQVTGVREDPYARAHRIPTEQRKVGRDDGRYLQPELYGQPPSKAIGAGG
jgi:hypothetical protein